MEREEHKMKSFLQTLAEGAGLEVEFADSSSEEEEEEEEKEEEEEEEEAEEEEREGKEEEVENREEEVEGANERTCSSEGLNSLSVADSAVDSEPAMCEAPDASHQTGKRDKGQCSAKGKDPETCIEVHSNSNRRSSKKRLREEEEEEKEENGTLECVCIFKV